MSDTPPQKSEMPEQRGDFMLLPPMMPTFGVPTLIQQLPREFLVTRRPVAVASEPVGHTIDSTLIGRVPGRARRRMRFASDALEHLLTPADEEWIDEGPIVKEPRASRAIARSRAPQRAALPTRRDVRRSVSSPSPQPRSSGFSEFGETSASDSSQETIPGELIAPPMPPSTFPGVGDSSSVVRRRGGGIPAAPASRQTPPAESVTLERAESLPGRQPNVDSLQPPPPVTPELARNLGPLASPDTAASGEPDSERDPSSAPDAELTHVRLASEKSDPFDAPPLQRRRSRGRITTPISPADDDSDLPPAVRKMLNEIDELQSSPEAHRVSSLLPPGDIEAHDPGPSAGPSVSGAATSVGDPGGSGGAELVHRVESQAVSSGSVAESSLPGLVATQSPSTSRAAASPLTSGASASIGELGESGGAELGRQVESGSAGSEFAGAPSPSIGQVSRAAVSVGAPGESGGAELVHPVESGVASLEPAVTTVLPESSPASSSFGSASNVGNRTDFAPQPVETPMTSLRATTNGTTIAATIPSTRRGEKTSTSQIRPVLAGRTGIQRRARSRPASGGSAAVTMSSGLAGFAGTPTPNVAGPRRIQVPEPIKQALRDSVGEPPTHVTVHEGAESADMTAAVNAEAFTRDGQIFLAGDAPLNSRRGQELLAHELTHVMQQGGSNGSMPSEHTREGQDLEARALAVERTLASGARERVSPTALARPGQGLAEPELHHRRATVVRETATPSTWSSALPTPASTQEAVIPQAMDVSPDIQRRERDLRSSALSRGLDSMGSALREGLMSNIEQEILGPSGSSKEKDSRYKRLERQASDLYPYIRARLRAELVRDRERRGRIARDWS